MVKDYKIVFLGNSSVGKTSLISQYFCSKIQNPTPTIAIDFLTTSYELNGKQVKLQVWDTAGQERFRSIVGNYVRNTFLAIVVFSVDDIASVDRVEGWIKDFIFLYNNNKEVKIMVVGNKMDLNTVAIDACIQKGKELAEKYNASFVTASALTREGIKQMISGINKFIEKDLDNPESETKNLENISLNATRNRRCC